MQVDGCGGQCCAVFPWATTPREMRQRWEDHPPGDVTVGGYNGYDELMIANMLIPLTRE